MLHSQWFSPCFLALFRETHPLCAGGDWMSLRLVDDRIGDLGQKVDNGKSKNG